MALETLLAHWLTTASATAIVIAGLSWFTLLYLLGVLGTRVMARLPLPPVLRGGQLDPRPLRPNQVGREITASALTIAIFGVGLLAPWWLLHNGWARFAAAPGPWQVLLECLVLLVWNEVHFYGCHRLLHTAALRRFHLTHHRSVVTTPWSTYSFHPVEALLLGSVLLPPMLFHDFSALALAWLTVGSLLINALGHSNIDFLPDAGRQRWWAGSARRHHLHHACYRGNFGFLLPWLDRWFGTALPADAAPVAPLAPISQNSPAARSAAQSLEPR